MNVGEANYFNQSLTLNYSLPFASIPYLDFVQSSYTYSGNFNWQTGPDILNNIIDSNGVVLGNISTIQNSNNQSIVASLNFDKFYRNFKFLNKKNNFYDILKSLKNLNKPVVLVINKIDRLRDKTKLLAFIKDISEKFNFLSIVLLCP